MYGATPLHNAVFTGSIAAMEPMLVSSDTTALLNTGASVLHLAAQQGISQVPAALPPTCTAASQLQQQCFNTPAVSVYGL